MYFQYNQYYPNYLFVPAFPNLSTKMFVTVLIFVLAFVAIISLLIFSRHRHLRIERLASDAFYSWRRAHWDLEGWIKANPELSLECESAQTLIHKELALLMILRFRKPLTQKELLREGFLLSVCRQDFVVSVFEKFEKKTRT
jgi:hypothetical protein